MSVFPALKFRVSELPFDAIFESELLRYISAF